jgi:DNA-binding transcriptional LysR family regulator
VAMHELQDQDFIAYAPESVLYRITADLCRQAGFQPRITQVVGETSTMLAFVAAGGGVAVMPSRVRAFQLDGVAYREIEDVPSVELAVAWLRGNHSTLLQNFLDVVAAATATPPLPAPPSGPAPFPSDERLSTP